MSYLSIKINIKDIFLFAIIFFYGFHSFGDLLPTTISQILIFGIFIIFLMDMLIKGYLLVNKFHFFFFLLILLITYFFNIYFIDKRTIITTVQLVIYFLTFFWLINYNKKDFYHVLKIYINIVLFFSIVAIVQELGYLIGIESLYNFKFIGVQVKNITTSGPFLRVYSLTTEPAHFVEISIAGAIISFGSFFNKDLKTIISRKKAIVILIAYLLTFSLLGYVYLTLALIFFVLFFSNWKSKVIFTCLSLMIIIILSPLNNFNKNSKHSAPLSKLDKLIVHTEYLFKGKENNIDNLSVLSILSNLKVTIKSFTENPLIGTGLDSYRKKYEEHIHSTYDEIRAKLNKKDAGSLYFRLLVEFGIIFLIVLTLLIWKYYLKGKDCNNSLIFVLNKIFLLSFLLVAIRNGNYLFPAKWIFISFYITSFQYYIQNKEEKTFNSN